MGQEATNSHLFDHKQYKMYLQHNEVFFVVVLILLSTGYAVKVKIRLYFFS